MTVGSETARLQYSGNGVTTAFSVTFPFLDNSHIEVIHTSAGGTDTTWVLNTDYTLSGAGGASGTLTAIEAPASGAMLTILRNVPLTQATDYVSNDEFPAETHEQNLDKLTMITQQLQEQLDRAILLEKSTTESPITAGSLSEALEALGAQAVAEGLYATSATSLAIGTGSKVFTVEEGKAFRAGDYVLVTSDANPTVNGMGGQVDSYSDTTLTITVPSGGTLGSGTYADWTIRISGPAGPQGASGAGTGDMLRSNNLSDVISAATSFSNIKQAATNAATGVVELATNTELLTGSDTGRAVTPDNIAALWEKAADVASAGTVSLGEGGFFHITGTTTITDIDFATAVDGRKAALIFDGILTLTHSSTLKLPGNANITTAAGDRAMIVQDSGDTMIMLWYQRAASGASNIGNMARRTITSADTVAGSDKGQVIEITSGTFSLAFTAAATLGTGFWSIITNTGNGNVTLDPNGSETIDGATSWVLYPGGSVLVVGDGSVFHSVLLAPMMVTFTSTGSFVVPGCGGHVLVELWGGGAGGARGASGNTANGGGGGGYGRYVYKMSDMGSVGSSLTATVGAGGAGATGTGAGSAGGYSQVGSYALAWGGESVADTLTPSGGGYAGGYQSRYWRGNLEPDGTTINHHADGYAGGCGGASQLAASGQVGGCAMWGGGGGGSAGQVGGLSVMGGNGGASSGTPTAGTQPGGGGGGSSSGGVNGAAGADGQVRITVY